MLRSQWLAVGAAGLVHWWNNKQSEERKARIERVNGQVRRAAATAAALP